MAKKTEAVLTITDVGTVTITISESIPDDASDHGQILKYGHNGFYDEVNKTYFPAHKIDRVQYVETPL
jgi:hypothetical protein